MKKALFVIGLLLFCFSTFGCQTSSTSTPSPYAGNWTMTVAGDLTGSASSSINSAGNFSFSVVVTYTGGGSFTDVIAGTVDSSGRVTGNSYYGGVKTGTIIGLIVMTAGSGTYTALPGYSGTGTWTITKI